MTNRPPCWPEGQPCPNPCADAHYRRTVYNQIDLTGPEWAGWRLAGRYLVAPDKTRITPERIRGLLWRQEAEARRDAARARSATGSQQLVRVVVVQLADYRANGVGAA